MFLRMSLWGNISHSHGSRWRGGKSLQRKEGDLRVTESQRILVRPWEAKDYGNSQILCAGTWPFPKLGPQALSGKQRKYGLMLGLVFWNESKPLRHKKPRGASLGDSWDAQVESLSRQNKGTAASSKTGKDSLVRSI